MTAEEEPTKTQKLAPYAVLLIVLLAIVGYSGYSFGVIQNSENFTITKSVTLPPVTKSETFTSNRIVTATITNNIVPTLAKTVQFSGNASTKNLGTSAQYLTFSTKDAQFKFNIVNGRYEASLPNRAQYAVTIHYSLSPTGAGDCDAGNLPLDSIGSSFSERISWSC